MSGILSEGDKRDSKHGSTMTLLRSQHLGLGRGGSLSVLAGRHGRACGVALDSFSFEEQETI